MGGEGSDRPCGDALSTMYPLQNRKRKSLLSPEDAWKQFRCLWGIFEPYPCPLDRSLRGEKPGEYSFGAFGCCGRCGHDPLSGIQKGRPSARGQCHYHWRHRWGGCLHGSNGESPGRKNSRRYCKESTEAAKGLEVRSGLCH